SRGAATTWGGGEAGRGAAWATARRGLRARRVARAARASCARARTAWPGAGRSSAWGLPTAGASSASDCLLATSTLAFEQAVISCPSCRWQRRMAAQTVGGWLGHHRCGRRSAPGATFFLHLRPYATPTAMTTLSVCMIVRDESELLPEFLCAAQGLYHELCVVDTGSTDGTLEILEDAGAKIVRVPWENDFAKARNLSLEMATSDWIMVLDADELVNDDFKTSVTETLSLDSAGAASIPIRNMLDNGNGVMSFLVRMFRNDRSIRYTHAIHEDVSDSLFEYLKRTGKSIVCIDGVVEHLGYVRERASARNKKSRDTQMLQGLLSKNPDDLYSWLSSQ
ncbi:MAG: glycosyltransferase family 2 protein, partial [Deltaproteobacteria bacterium]